MNLIRQDDWHAVMNRRHELVRLARYDRAGMQPLIASGRFPAFPEASKYERRIESLKFCLVFAA
jgi:hypothetical protein